MDNATAQPLVLKFGGSSMATPELIQSVAQIVQTHHKTHQKLVVVVSAMGKSTDELIRLAKQVSPMADANSNRREMDMLLSTGERVSIALLCLALSDLGLDAVSLTGAQSGILTDLVHGEAQISEIRPIRIEESLESGKVVVVAGFQGVSRLKKEITTLGRGGSDTTAVALAVALNASECLIYTDVAGVFTADPRIVPNAQPIESMTWNEASEAATRGSKVLHSRCVELAWKHKMPLRILSTFQPKAAGTLVRGESTTLGTSSPEPLAMESAKLSSLAHQEIIRIRLDKDRQNLDALQTLRELVAVGVKPMVWRQSATALSFAIPKTQLGLLSSLGFLGQFEAQPCTRVCLIGVGLETYPSIYIEALKLLQPLSTAVLSASLQPHAIEIFVTSEHAADAVRSLHALF